MVFSGSAMNFENLSVLKNPVVGWGGVAPSKRLRKNWEEGGRDAITALEGRVKPYVVRHGAARLIADPDANLGQTQKKVMSSALEALKKVYEENENQDDMRLEEKSVNDVLKQGLRDYIDDALDEAERYKRVDRTVKSDFRWEMVGNFNEFPALRRSRDENGPGKPYNGTNPKNFEAMVFAESNLGLILESPRNGQWSRFGGELPVILDVLPGSASARARPRIKRGFRLGTVNGISLATLGPEGFKRMLRTRPLRLGVDCQPLDYCPGAASVDEDLRPDLFRRTMAVDFLRDFGPSADEKDAARIKKTLIENSIPWADSKGLPDLERRVTKLQQSLRSTGWPPGVSKPQTATGDMRSSRLGIKASVSFVAPVDAPFEKRASVSSSSTRATTSSSTRASSAPHVGFGPL